MKRVQRITRIGIIGCGAIGSRIAASVGENLKGYARLSALYDIDVEKSKILEKKLLRKSIAKNSITDLIKASDLIVEAVASPDTKKIIRRILEAKKDILVMSTGQLLNADGLFRLAQKNRCHLLLPTGAISGIDAIKAARSAGLTSVILTTRKNPRSLKQSNYLTDQGINLKNLKGKTTIFDGNVKTAVGLFPENINVAATVALASGLESKLRVRIIASPVFKTNSHENE